MNKLPQISDAEFEVMDIIWKYAPISTNEITDRLAKTKKWSPKTIYTMLSRLEKKGVIVHEKESRVFVYTPCVKKDDYLAAESRTLATRFFDGAMKQMVVSFLDQKDLTPEDLDEFLKLASTDINTADKEALMELPGIGEVLSDRILKYRAQHGPFADWSEFLQIQGIGEHLVETLRPVAYLG